MVELKQWTILIALFSYYVPPSCVCYCRAVGYVGIGAKAEPAESEHSISNNLKFCVVILGLFLKWLAGKGALGLWPMGIKCQITRYAKGSQKSEQCYCSTSCYAAWSARARRLCPLFRLTCASEGSSLRKTPQSNNTSPTSKWLKV